MTIPITQRATIFAFATLEGLATTLGAVLSSGEIPHTASVVDVDVDDLVSFTQGEVAITLEWSKP